MNALYEEAERLGKRHEAIRQLEYDRAQKSLFTKQKVIQQEIELQISEEKDAGSLLDAVSKSMKQNACEKTFLLSEDSFAKELGERKLQNQREQKIRQQLWENTPELKELHKKILIAHVTRDQALQMAEKQALEGLMQQEKEELARSEALEKEQEKAKERKNAAAKLHAQIQYHKELDEQLHLNAAKKVINEQQTISEKAEIEKIFQKILEEEQMRRKKKIEMQKELYEQAQELQKARNEIRQNEAFLEEKRKLKDYEYRKAQELRAKELDERKKLILENKFQLQQDLLKHLEQMYKGKERQELIRIELAVEEKEESERAKAEETKERKSRIPEELNKIYATQIWLKKQKEDLQKKEDEAFSKRMMAKLYEEDRLELMSQQKRRMKQAAHRRLVQEMIKANEHRKAFEQAQALENQKCLEEAENERKKLVEEEKLAFLRENAKELLGYLPKGVLKDDKEIEQLGEEFQRFYIRKNGRGRMCDR